MDTAGPATCIGMALFKLACLWFSNCQFDKTADERADEVNANIGRGASVGFQGRRSNMRSVKLCDEGWDRAYLLTTPLTVKLQNTQGAVEWSPV